MLLLAVALAATTVGAAASPPRGDLSATPVHPRELRDSLEKAEKYLGKAERALSRRNPGRVSTLLRGADEALSRLERQSGLEPLVEVLTAARTAATARDLEAADAAMRRARALMPALADYTVTRQAEIAFRAARSAVAAADRDRHIEAIGQMESAILAPTLLAHLRSAREAISRGRAAMVRRDVSIGKEELAAARRSLGALRYAGALSRALFALRMGSELLADGVGVATREHVRKGLREMRAAIELAPKERLDDLKSARDELEAVWGRMSRPKPEDAEKLDAIARAVESARRDQGPSGAQNAEDSPP
jgi:hypothetical protein